MYGLRRWRLITSEVEFRHSAVCVINDPSIAETSCENNEIIVYYVCIDTWRCRVWQIPIGRKREKFRTSSDTMTYGVEKKTKPLRKVRFVAVLIVNVIFKILSYALLCGVYRNSSSNIAAISLYFDPFKRKSPPRDVYYVTSFQSFAVTKIVHFSSRAVRERID